MRQSSQDLGLDLAHATHIGMFVGQCAGVAVPADDRLNVNVGKGPVRKSGDAAGKSAFSQHDRGFFGFDSPCDRGTNRAGGLLGAVSGRHMHAA